MTTRRTGLLLFVLLAIALAAAEPSVQGRITIPHTRLGGMLYPKALEWDETNQVLYVGGKAGSVFKLDGNGRLAAELPLADGTQRVTDILVVPELDRVYVLCRGGRVRGFSSSGRLLADVSVSSEASPYGYYSGILAYSPTANKVLCVGPANYVMAVDATTHEVTEIPFFGYHHSSIASRVLVCPDVNRVFIRNHSRVWYLDAAKLEAGEPYDIPTSAGSSGSGGMAFDPQRQRLLVTRQRMGFLLDRDLVQQDQVMLDDRQGACVFDETRDVFYCISEYHNRVRMVSGAGMSSGSIQLPPGSGPLKLLALDSGSDRLLVSGRRLWAFDLLTNTSVVPAGIDETATELVASGDGRAFFLVYRQPVVQAVSSTDGRLIWRFATGIRPSELQLTLDGRRLWALDQDSRVVALVGLDEEECLGTCVLPTGFRSATPSRYEDRLFCCCGDGVYAVSPADLSATRLPGLSLVERVVGHSSGKALLGFSCYRNKVLQYDETTGQVTADKDFDDIGLARSSVTFIEPPGDFAWYADRTSRVIARVRFGTVDIDEHYYDHPYWWPVLGVPGNTPKLLFQYLFPESLAVRDAGQSFKVVGKVKLPGQVYRMLWNPAGKLLYCSMSPPIGVVAAVSVADPTAPVVGQQRIMSATNVRDMVFAPDLDRLFAVTKESQDADFVLSAYTGGNLDFAYSVPLESPNVRGIAYDRDCKTVCIGDAEHSTVILVGEVPRSDFGVFPGRLPFPLPLVSRGRTTRTLTLSNDGDRAMTWNAMASPPRPWLQVARRGPNPLPPGKEAAVLVTVDAARLPEGGHRQSEATVLLTSDDPDLPLVKVPVTVTRTEPEKPTQGEKTGK